MSNMLPLLNTEDVCLLNEFGRKNRKHVCHQHWQCALPATDWAHGCRTSPVGMHLPMWAGPGQWRQMAIMLYSSLIVRLIAARSVAVARSLLFVRQSRTLTNYNLGWHIGHFLACTSRRNFFQYWRLLSTYEIIRYPLTDINQYIWVLYVKTLCALCSKCLVSSYSRFVHTLHGAFIYPKYCVSKSKHNSTRTGRQTERERLKYVIRTASEKAA